MKRFSKLSLPVLSLLCMAQVYADLQPAEKSGALTVADGVESRRAMVDMENRAVFVSPDGRRYVMMLINGDIAADGLYAKIFLGRVSAGRDAEPKPVRRFFTRGFGSSAGFWRYGATALTMPHANPPMWIDNERIAFLWEDDSKVIQVVSVHVSTGEATYLTRSRTDVQGFVVTDRGAVLYEALAAHSREESERLMRTGFAVTSPEAVPMLAGYVDGRSVFDFFNCDRYLLMPGAHEAVRVELASRHHCGSGSLLKRRSAFGAGVLSPDGAHAIVNVVVKNPPDEWNAYEGVTFKSMLQERKRNPNAIAPRLIQQIVLVDTTTGESRPLWNAPHKGYDDFHAVWSPDSKALLVWPVYLPLVSSDPVGRKGAAMAEVDIESGAHFSIPMEKGSSAQVREARYLGKSRLELTLEDGSRAPYQQVKRRWSPSASYTPAPERPADRSDEVRIELRQDANTPPALYSVNERTGQAQRLFDLNPQLTSKTLGRVKTIRWKEPSGREWKGRLYYPMNYVEGRRYPVVIQARCVAREDEFSLYGCGDQYPTLGPGWSSFIAQALAAEEIAVLQIGGSVGGVDFDAASGDGATSVEWITQKWLEAGWRAGAEYLIDIGLAERKAIGLLGFSLTGWVAEYVLAHSEFRYAAAIASDHANMGYLTAALNGWQMGPANAAGAEPFGDGLQAWRLNAPVFNVERIHTPLQLQLTNSSEGNANLLWQWEMFSRLRALDKPVEYYVAPDVWRGSHTLQNPRQVLALQNRALDWWCFWLKGEERPGPGKDEQYKSWRELRKLHMADLAERVRSGEPTS